MIASVRTAWTSSGRISGVGLASAKMIGLAAIFATIAGFNAPVGGKPNQGINIAAPAGTPIKAAASGVVAYAGNELRGYGNLVLIQHGDGLVTAYAHAASLSVKKGDQVAAGQTIGTVGQTGAVDQPQLHFEVRKNSTPVDPKQYLP